MYVCVHMYIHIYLCVRIYIYKSLFVIPLL